jgi:hypothetical protein
MQGTLQEQEVLWRAFHWAGFHQQVQAKLIIITEHMLLRPGNWKRNAKCGDSCSIVRCDGGDWKTVHR